MGLINWVRGLRSRYDASVKRLEVETERDRERFHELSRKHEATKGAGSEPDVHPGKPNQTTT